MDTTILDKKDWEPIINLCIDKGLYKLPKPEDLLEVSELQASNKINATNAKLLIRWLAVSAYFQYLTPEEFSFLSLNYELKLKLL
jgi:hypothetical protein